MYVLDTDVVIDIQRGHAQALAWFASLAELPAVPGFVVMELIQDALNMHQGRQALRIVARLPIIWPTEANCNRALGDFTSYHLSHNLGLLDSLIAACATGQAATLCTFNAKHYRMIPNLAIEQPYTR